MEIISGDRRGSARYSLQLRLRYRVMAGLRPLWRGTGATLDISRTGMRFRTSRDLPVNSRVEVTIDWPVRFGELYPMELALNGPVVRSEDGETVMVISSWQFRVAASDNNKVPAGETVRAQGWSPRCRVRGDETPLPMTAVM